MAQERSPSPLDSELSPSPADSKLSPLLPPPPPAPEFDDKLKVEIINAGVFGHGFARFRDPKNPAKRRFGCYYCAEPGKLHAIGRPPRHMTFRHFEAIKQHWLKTEELLEIFKKDLPSYTCPRCNRVYYREDEFRIHCAKPHDSDDGLQVDEPADDTDADGESDVAVVKDDSDSPVYRRRLDEDYDGPEDHITADAQVDTESVNQDINTWNARTGNLAEAQSGATSPVTPSPISLTGVFRWATTVKRARDSSADPSESSSRSQRLRTATDDDNTDNDMDVSSDQGEPVPGSDEEDELDSDEADDTMLADVDMPESVLQAETHTQRHASPHNDISVEYQFAPSSGRTPSHSPMGPPASSASALGSYTRLVQRPDDVPESLPPGSRLPDSAIRSTAVERELDPQPLPRRPNPTDNPNMPVRDGPELSMANPMQAVKAYARLKYHGGEMLPAIRTALEGQLLNSGYDHATLEALFQAAERWRQQQQHRAHRNQIAPQLINGYRVPPGPNTHLVPYWTQGNIERIPGPPQAGPFFPGGLSPASSIDSIPGYAPISRVAPTPGIEDFLTLLQGLSSVKVFALHEFLKKALRERMSDAGFVGQLEGPCQQGGRAHEV